MFPFVGRMDVGLESYGRYVCQGVAARDRDILAAKRQAAANGAIELSDFFYANATLLAKLGLISVWLSRTLTTP